MIFYSALLHAGFERRRHRQALRWLPIDPACCCWFPMHQVIAMKDKLNKQDAIDVEVNKARRISMEKADLSRAEQAKKDEKLRNKLNKTMTEKSASQVAKATGGQTEMNVDDSGKDADNKTGKK